MLTGRVIGEIVSTINHPFYDAKKLLVVEATDPNGSPRDEYVIAIDIVDAGVGEAVLVNNEGNGARDIFQAPNAPVRSVVVGIIDAISTE